MKWSKEWPIKEGIYWFYGYRYGKTSCGRDCEPEFCLVRVDKISNGLMFTAEGQFMYKSEVEEGHFQKAVLPDPPSTKKLTE